MAGYAFPDILVETQWVSNHIDDPNVRLIEAAYDTEKYDLAHIPGALPWTWKQDFQHPLYKDIPDKEGWESLLARTGIAKDTTVVVYGAPSKYYATYAIWLLTIFGHRDIRLMNGGIEKWTAECRPVTTEVPAVTSIEYQAQEPDWTIRALRDLVHESIDESSRIIVDVRDRDEYCGVLSPTWKLPEDGGQRGGHIPSAVNITWDMVLQDDGTFKPVEVLQEIYSSQGVTAEKEVLTYCVIGGRSSHSWFVLKYLMGYPQVRLYDGSWLEWGGLIGVPIDK
jgi:thiosulfate/3-mercaptopyruvate sulfurtransferase